MDSDYKNYDISNIAGHKKQLEFLKGLFFSGRMPSGLLFYGQKNIGKRFTAAAFAASVLCGDYRAFAGEGGGPPPSEFLREMPFLPKFFKRFKPQSFDYRAFGKRR